MLRRVIFQKLRATSGNIIQLMSFKSPLFYNHHNHENDVTIIPSTMGTRQGDPLGAALFVLAHFKALCSTANHFPSCLFPSIVNNTHIIYPPLIVSSAYEHFQTKLHVIGLSIQPHKCIAWPPFGLPWNFNAPSQFTTQFEGIKILGVPFGTLTFTSSFIKETLKKMFNMWTFSLKWVMFRWVLEL